MALSNWDTLAVDENGEPTNGVINSKGGVSVAIYKNWLYVRDKKAWRKGGDYINDTMMEVTEGELKYFDVKIMAKRGPKNGVYVIVETPTFGEDRQIMVGIGCYGYSDDEVGTWCGIQQAEIDFLKAMLTEKDEYGFVHDEKITNIDLTKALRFNQGDAFFADNLTLEIPATSPGEATEPMLMTMLKKKEEK